MVESVKRGHARGMTTINRIEIPTPFVLDRVNCYYLNDSNPTLIDAGVDTDDAFEALKAGIGSAGGSIRGIRRVLLTHAHADHIGLVNKVVDQSGAEVFIHRLDAPKMPDSGEQGASLLRTKYKEFFHESGAPEPLTEEFLEVLFKRLKRYFIPFEDAKPLEGSEIFSFDDFDLEIIHTPGHSPGSACALNKSDGTLFSGDTLLEKITSNPVVEVKPSKDNRGYKSLETYKATLDNLALKPVTTVMPGHGAPFSNHHKRIQDLLDHHEERTRQVIEILRSHSRDSDSIPGLTRYQMTQLLFNNLKGMDVFLGLSEIKGHLEILETRGLVSTVFKDEMLLYSL